MKNILLPLIAGVLLTLTPAFADDATNAPSIMLDYNQADISQVLNIYKKSAGLELVIDSRARVATLITIKTPAPVTEAEALKVMERALISQAGVVITRLDDKRASVTFNDHLTIQPVK